MTRELYEETYKNARHFRFGENWREFLHSLTPAQVERAKTSLTDSLGFPNLRGKRFLDMGCGSGLFSLASFELSASEVVSVDVDEDSIACVKVLRGAHHRPTSWIVKKGSVLDRRFLSRLGSFDVIYSWGVLHHTGDMYRAIENTSKLVKPGGKLCVALYNENKANLFHGTSAFWRRVKQKYNQSGPVTKKIFYYLYATYLILGLFATGRNPARYIQNYRSNRGMSWKHDVIDWLGGYPYEFASPDKIINFLGVRHFACVKLRVSNTIGNNEYLFVRSKR